MSTRDYTKAISIAGNFEVAGPYDSVTKEGNFDSNRTAIDAIVLHTIVGTIQSAADRFADSKSNVSTHYGIGYDGKLYTFLEEYYVAYANGNYPVNQRAISIEHEDLRKPNDPRPDTLYITSAKLVRDICQFYAIPIDRQHILKHSEVSDIPTACPDALDIDRIVKEAATVPDDLQKQLDQCRIDRDTHWNDLQAAKIAITDIEAQLQQLKTICDNQTQQINDRNNDIVQLNAKISTLNTQVLSQQQSIDSLTPLAKQATTLQTNLSQCEIDRTRLLGEKTQLQKTIEQLNKKLATNQPQNFWEKLKYVLNL